jgi:cobalamin biosynthesis protein CbiD
MMMIGIQIVAKCPAECQGSTTGIAAAAAAAAAAAVVSIAMEQHYCSRSQE